MPFITRNGWDMGAWWHIPSFGQPTNYPDVQCGVPWLYIVLITNFRFLSSAIDTSTSVILIFPSMRWLWLSIGDGISIRTTLSPWMTQVSGYRCSFSRDWILWCKPATLTAISSGTFSFHKYTAISYKPQCKFNHRPFKYSLTATASF